MSHDNYSLSAKVYNHIRDGILAGTFAKGDELKEKNIGDELGVSRTPVREALRQLELEGLVSIIPNKGAFVEGVSTDDIRDIYEIRALLEGLCARWAAAADLHFYCGSFRPAAFYDFSVFFFCLCCSFSLSFSRTLHSMK